MNLLVENIEEDMAIGIKRSKDVLYNMYRIIFYKEDYESYIDYDIKQDFLPAENVDVASKASSTLFTYEATNSLYV